MRTRWLLAAAAAFALVGVLATTVGPTSNTSINDLSSTRTSRAWSTRALALRARRLRVPAGRARADVAGRAHGRLRSDVRAAHARRGPGRVLDHGAPVRGGRGLGRGVRRRADRPADRSSARCGARTSTPRRRAMAMAAARAGPRPPAPGASACSALGTMTKLFPAAARARGPAVAPGPRRNAARRWRGAAAFAVVVALIGAALRARTAARAHGALPPRPAGADRVHAGDGAVVVGGSYVTGDPVARPLQVQRARRRAGRRRAGGRHARHRVAARWRWPSRPAAPDPTRSCCCGAGAPLLAFVALGKVLSPQYVIWLLPLRGAVPGPARRRRRAGADRGGRGADAARVPRRYFDSSTATLGGRRSSRVATPPARWLGRWPAAGRSTCSIASARSGC